MYPVYKGGLRRACPCQQIEAVHATVLLLVADDPEIMPQFGDFTSTAAVIRSAVITAAVIR